MHILQMYRFNPNYGSKVVSIQIDSPSPLVKASLEPEVFPMYGPVIASYVLKTQHQLGQDPDFARSYENAHNAARRLLGSLTVTLASAVALVIAFRVFA